MKTLILPLALLATSSALGANKEIEKLADAFFKYPEFETLKPSPDGKWLAFSYYNKKGNEAFKVIEIAGKDHWSVNALFENDIVNFAWVDSNRIISTVVTDGFFDGFQIMDKQRDLHYYLPYKRTSDGRMGIAVRIVSALPDVEGKILLSYNDKPGVRYQNLVEYDVIAKEERTIFTEKDGMTSFNPDVNGDVRFAFMKDPDDSGESGDGGMIRHKFDKETQKWVPRRSDFRVDHILLLNPDDRAIVELSQLDVDPRRGLAFVNLDKGEIISKVLREAPFDIDTEGYFKVGGQVLGVHYHTDRPKTVWFDPKMRVLQEGIDKMIPNRVNRIISADPELKAFAIHSFSDVFPGEVYLFNLAEKTLKPVLRNEMPSGNVKPASRLPVQFPGEDGATLFGYLTLPSDPEGPHPTIISLIGGPTLREKWGYNPEAQFFAALGYAFLEVNYRGCDGYGQRYLGRKLSHPVGRIASDANAGAQWAIQQGWADPDRMAVMGSSFGGYGAMITAIQYPDTFQAVVAASGVYDWLEMGEYDDSYDHVGAFRHTRDIKQREDFYREHSPVFHADKIKADVLLFHGRDDRRVPLRHATAMRDALREHNVSLTYRFVEYLPHGFPEQEQRIDYYVYVAEFLEEHLKNRPPAPMPDGAAPVLTATAE